MNEIFKWWHDVTAGDILQSAIIVIPCMALCLFLVLKDISNRAW